MQRLNWLLIFVCSVVLFSNISLAEERLSNPIPNGSYLLAQEEGDDSYDPFSDYSEFEEETDEEADINFFKNGRFFTLGFMFGLRGFTDSMSQKYDMNATYGLYLSYFFDLRFALQFGYILGDHGLTLSNDSLTLKGTASFNLMQFNLKYFFNTQNVTRGLANLNPYLVGGFSNITRTLTVTGLEGFGKDSATSLDGGIGIEIPMLRNKMFLGIQVMYHYVNFRDEGSLVVIDNQSFGTQAGDTWDSALILGTNF